MKYLFSTESQYGYLSILTADTRKQVPLRPFGDMMSQYVKMCIHEWYFGFDIDDRIQDFQNNLSRYLTVQEATAYTSFLYTTLWIYIDSNLDENIGYTDELNITVDEHLILTIEIIPQNPVQVINPLTAVINDICIEVEQKLYSGDYIHPRLKEIYDARRHSSFP